MPGPNEGVRVVCYVLVVSAHAGKKFLNMKMLVQLFLLHNFLHNHMLIWFNATYVCFL
jgi:hypothetical protein